ncbi:hypothetical protein V2J09_002351 [Rumex salicifolius]
MANQPPRPWFRLPNLARQAPPPPPPPAPEPQAPPPQQPRIPLIRPAFRPAFTQSQPSSPPLRPAITQSRPSSPPRRPAITQSQPSSPPPTQPPLPISSSSPSPSPSPRLPRIATTSRASPSPSPTPTPPYVSYRPSSTRMSRLPTPTPSPKSPIKATHHSPPPITLPPPQSKAELEPRTLPEAEQEKVLLQDTFNKKVVFPAASSHDQGSSVKGFIHKAISKNHKKPSSLSSDSEDGKNVRIITMTGENKGALMELGLANSRRNNEGKTLGNFPGSGHVLGNGYKQEGEDLNGGNADRSKIKDREGNETSSRLPMSGYVNSNVQGINNSILYNSSFTHHDPGVHFSVSRKKPINGKAHGNGHANGKKL